MTLYATSWRRLRRRRQVPTRPGNTAGPWRAIHNLLKAARAEIDEAERRDIYIARRRRAA